MVLNSEDRTCFIGKDLFLETKSLFEDEEITLWGHDLKKILKVLFLFDIKVKNKLFDVMLAAYLLSPGARNHEVGQGRERLWR